MNEKKQYKVLNPIGHSGRRERGEIVLLTEDESANFGAEYVELVVAQEVSAKVETPIDEMTVKQLREKAKELGLDEDGSKSELLERIQLSLE